MNSSKNYVIEPGEGIHLKTGNQHTPFQIIYISIIGSSRPKASEPNHPKLTMGSIFFEVGRLPFVYPFFLSNSL